MLGKIGGHFPATNFIYAPSMQDPEIERDVITYDTSKATDDEVIACYFTCATEYPRMLKLHKLAGGIRKAPVEVKSFIPGLLSGIVGVLNLSDRAETSVKNLFIAGCASSSTGSSGSKAMVWGHIVGDYMKDYVESVKSPVFGAGQANQVDAEKQRVMAPLAQRKGVDALELEDYVRQANMNYIGVRKIGPRLKRAIEIFESARERAVPVLSAANPHELMRALEVQDIIDLSELHAQACLMRTESRMIPSHYRLDYPNPDDENWANMIVTQQKVGGEERISKERIE